MIAVKIQFIIAIGSFFCHFLFPLKWNKNSLDVVALDGFVHFFLSSAIKKLINSFIKSICVNCDVFFFLFAVTKCSVNRNLSHFDVLNFFDCFNLVVICGWNKMIITTRAKSLIIFFLFVIFCFCFCGRPHFVDKMIWFCFGKKKCLSQRLTNE